MALVLFLARSSRARLTGALLASIASGAGVALLIALINESLRAPRDELPQLGLKFACISVAMLSLRWFALSQFVCLGQVALARLRVLASTQLSEAPFRALESYGAARLMGVLSEDIARVGESIVMLPRLVVHGVVLLGCLGYLASLSWRVFSVGLCVMLLGSLGYAQRARAASGYLRAARRGEHQLYEDFRALFSGAKELKLNAPRRAAFVAQLSENVDQVRAARTRGMLIHVAAVSARVFLLFAAIGAVLFVLQGLFAMSRDVRSGYALMLLYMMLPLHALLEALPALSRTRLALEQLAQVGVRVPEQRPVQTLAPAARFESLRLREITHSYRRDDEEGVFAFGPVSLELAPSELVFVVGGNGSGKTTLAKLLVGLYEPEGGELWLNGQRIGDAERVHYREQFSAVFSDFHLFDSLLGHGVHDEHARGLLASLDLAHKVTIRDGVFSTTELSSGQRKRLALLVACLEDRPLMVFDEWTADQDPQYKEVFYAQILPELKARGKAVLVITHDDRYFKVADRLLKLESGRLVPFASAQPVKREFRLHAAAMGDA
jgi:putative pyoverdin transport system ATP-binding/permease protein